jgi:hypothetical protein
MPLRDHFRPPVLKRSSWEGFHGMWPATMVQRLFPQLPPEYIAEPRAHLGSYYEIDVSAYEETEPRAPALSAWETSGGGLATATWAPPEPTLVVDADWAEQYAYEVLIYDESRARQLVAAVEIVSPANKDRPENRRAFVTKCAAMLQQKVSVSIVDPVTIRHFNLYTELLALLDRKDPAFAPNPPPTYAATCRCRMIDNIGKLEAWAYPLVVGQALPTLPVWLTEDLKVSLELEASYEDTCRVLRLA